MDFSNLTGKELYSDEVIAYVMDEEDPLIREQLGFDLLDRAAVFGDRIEKRVERMLKIAEKDRAAKERERKNGNHIEAFSKPGIGLHNGTVLCTCADLCRRTGPRRVC